MDRSENIEASFVFILFSLLSLLRDPLGFLRGSLGPILEPVAKHLGHMLPKDWILKAFGIALGGQDGQFDSNLAAQDLAKSMQEREKGHLQKLYVFGIDFLGARVSFWKKISTIF